MCVYLSAICTHTSRCPESDCSSTRSAVLYTKQQHSPEEQNNPHSCPKNAALPNNCICLISPMSTRMSPFQLIWPPKRETESPTKLSVINFSSLRWSTASLRFQKEVSQWSELNYPRAKPYGSSNDLTHLDRQTDSEAPKLLWSTNKPSYSSGTMGLSQISAKAFRWGSLRGKARLCLRSWGACGSARNPPIDHALLHWIKSVLNWNLPLYPN